MNLSSFKDIDPDEIYNKSDYKITFFYIPAKDEIIYDASQSHDDLLNNKVIWNKVFPNIPFTKKDRRNLALDSNIFVGRFGALQNDMVVSLWNSLENPALDAFQKKLLKTFPNLKKVDIIIVGKEKEPRVMQVGIVKKKYL